MASHKTFSKTQFLVAGLEVDVLRKDVKNLNLRVYPAEKRVRVSVPRRIPDRAVVQFIEEKLPWIKKHLANYRKKPNRVAPGFFSGEKHWVWGKELKLHIIKKNEPPKVCANESSLILQVRPESSQDKKATVLKEWYRVQLKKEIPKLIEKWEPEMRVKVNEFGVKQMKTRWGTCNIRAKRIWLNLELAKKRPELLEYVVIHEMVHLLERLHNKRFYKFMSLYLPHWESLKNELNGKSGISDC